MPIILEDCFVASYQLGVLDTGADAFDFSQLTTEPTAPSAADDAASDLQCSMGFAPDAFGFTTEPTAPEAGKVYSKPLTFTATVTVPDADGHDVGDDLAVDPNNPNADLLATPGPDDDLELPAVQKVGAFRDGLSLPDLSLPAVQDDGLLTTEPTDAGAIAGIVIAATSDNNRSDDGATPLVLVTDADPEAAIAGIIIAATSDNNRVAIDDGADVLTTEPTDAGAIAGIVIAATSDNNRSDDGADYSGSHLLYQDVMIPTLDAETIFRPSDAVWW